MFFVLQIARLPSVTTRRHVVRLLRSDSPLSPCHSLSRPPPARSAFTPTLAAYSKCESVGRQTHGAVVVVDGDDAAVPFEHLPVTLIHHPWPLIKK